MNFIYLDEVDSTNNYAKKLLENKSDAELSSLNETVISANSQSAGRGRLNRDFFSPKGKGLYFSLIYLPQKQISNPAEITVASSLAICKSLEKFFNNTINLKIKWVNDLYLNDKKVGGILTEGILDNSLGKIAAYIIGIGININTSSFPEEISHKAASISKENLSPSEKKDLILKISQEVFNVCATEDKSQIFNEYKNRSFLINKTVTVHPIINSEESFLAKVIDITPEAKLKVQIQNNEIKELDSGEITLH